MDIVVTGKVDKNHRLTAKLPESVPAGEVEVIIKVPQLQPTNSVQRNRASELKAAFEAAGYPQYQPTPEQATEIESTGVLSETALEAFVASLPDDMPISDEMIRDVRGED